MSDQALVPQEIQDVLDGKVEQAKPPATSNQRLIVVTPRPARHVVKWFLRTFGYDGITLPPWGIYIRAECLADQRLCRHELAHWAQYQRMGAVKFYAVYLWLLVRHGYQNHPMEIEARRAE